MDRCSVTAQAIGEPLTGTAPVTRSWLLVEQPGPWGRNAVQESRLDDAVGAELTRRAKQAGMRLGLLRRVAGETDEARTALLARTDPGGTRLRRVEFTDPAELLRIDLDDDERWPGEDVTEPVVVVCTNGKRDVCCAVAGRPLALDLARELPGRVWEGSHLGGHRFAPTAVVLPTGYLYGRLSVEAALRTVEAAAKGQVLPGGCRGRSTWSRPGQVAELAVRSAVEEWDADALRVEPETALPRREDADGDGERVWQVPVAHRDGRRWQVEVASRADGVLRPESCGKVPANPVSLVVTGIEDEAAGEVVGVA